MGRTWDRKSKAGEPSLNVKVIDHFCQSLLASGTGIHVTFGLISNGSFAFPPISALLERYNIRMSISVDGFQHSHDQVRFTMNGNERLGTWSIVEQNVDHLIRSGIPPYLLYTITPLNATSVEQFTTWAHSRGLGFRVSPVRMKRPPSDSEIQTVKTALESLYASLAHTMPVDLHFERDARFAEWNLKKKKAGAWGSCRNYVAITEKGEIRPCQMSARTDFNVALHTIDQALTGFSQDSSTRPIAEPATRTGACTQCEYYHVCAGGCPQHTLAPRGSADQPSSRCNLFGGLMLTYVKAKGQHLRRKIAFLRQEATTRAMHTLQP